MKKLLIKEMRRILLLIPCIFIFGCSDSAKMESAEEAAYNDAVASCIYRNGNPRYGTEEYRSVERMCENS